MIDNSFDNSAEEAWLQAKWGMFSGSNISKLIFVKAGDGDMFPKGSAARTYIKKVAREAYTLFNTEDSVQTYDMKMGKVREAQSVAFWKQATGITVPIEYYGDANPHFEKFDDNSGCSPDVVVFRPDGTASFGAEFKNPKGDTHDGYLFSIDNQFDLKKVASEYFAQCQFSMMTYKCDLWHWCSHNEFFPPKDRLLLVEVEKDKAFCDNLLIRLKMASKIKHKIIEMHKNGFKGNIDDVFNKI